MSENLFGLTVAADKGLDDLQCQRLLSENLKYQEIMLQYRCALKALENRLEILNEEFSLRHDRNPIESIKTRLKSPESIAEKLQRRGFPLTVESIEQNLNDIAGVRVICSFPSDIYQLADAFLKQDDITLLQRKDYIAEPKPNGYRSLHLIVEVPIFLENEKRPMKVEVQLRTIAMDFWASLEHKLRYKKEIPEAEAVQMAEELTECANVIADWDKKMGEIRNRIERYSEEKDESLPAIGLARIINRD